MSAKLSAPSHPCEGPYVRFADDSIHSVQCFEGRHAECPDTTPPHLYDIPDHGPLDGYYCECPHHLEEE